MEELLKKFRSDLRYGESYAQLRLIEALLGEVRDLRGSALLLRIRHRLLMLPESSLVS